MKSISEYVSPKRPGGNESPLPVGWRAVGYVSPNDGEFVVDVEAPAGIEARIYLNDELVHGDVVPPVADAPSDAVSSRRGHGCVDREQGERVSSCGPVSVEQVRVRHAERSAELVRLGLDAEKAGDYRGADERTADLWSQAHEDLSLVLLLLGAQSRPEGVGTYLDLSTAHLSEAERRALEVGDPGPDGLPRVVPHLYGWWVHVPLDEPEQAAADAAAAGFPGLGAALRLAAAHSCSWINFDADAAALDALPTHEEG